MVPCSLITFSSDFYCQYETGTNKKPSFKGITYLLNTSWHRKASESSDNPKLAPLRDDIFNNRSVGPHWKQWGLITAGISVWDRWLCSGNVPVPAVLLHVIRNLCNCSFSKPFLFGKPSIEGQKTLLPFVQGRKRSAYQRLNSSALFSESLA